MEFKEVLVLANEIREAGIKREVIHSDDPYDVAGEPGYRYVYGEYTISTWRHFPSLHAVLNVYKGKVAIGSKPLYQTHDLSDENEDELRQIIEALGYENKKDFYC